MVSPVFARLLAAGRAEFNRRTQEAARRQSGFDHGALTAFLADGVDAVVQAVDAVAPERALDVAFDAYDIALALAAQRLVGPAARSALLPAVWREVLPRLAALVAREPAATMGMLSNAALHLGTIPEARGAQWAAELAALAPRIASRAELRAVGQILAWRAGAAHFRAGAIEAGAGVPEPLALAAFGVSDAESWPALRECIGRDPWWRVGDGVGLAQREIGSFVGLGGSFGAPPELRAAPGGFFVHSAGQHFLLVADAYGAVLMSATAGEFAQVGAAAGAVGFRVEGDAVVVGRQRITLDLPAAGLAVCASAGTLAITSPCTHAIRLAPRR
jgi:hypothetical protein